MKPIKKYFQWIALLLVLTLITGNVLSVMAEEELYSTEAVAETSEETESTEDLVPEEQEEEFLEESSDSELNQDGSDVPEENNDPAQDDPAEGEDPAEDSSDAASEDVTAPAEDDVIPSETENTAAEEEETEIEVSETPDDTELPDSEEKTEIQPAQTEGEETTGDFTFTLNSETNKYTVRIGNFSTPETITGIQVKVYSDAKGDDDAKWLTLKASATGSTYWASSYIQDFKNYGKAIAEFYLVKEDQTTELIETKKLNIKAPSITGSEVTTNEKKSSISVKVIGFGSDLAMESVKACVWRKSDKSDLKWYTLENKGTSYYYSNIYAEEFGGYSGTYKVRVLAYPLKGTAKELVNTTVEMAECNGYCSYSDNYSKKGSLEKSYRLKIRGIAHEKGISSVEFEVWHDGDYDKRKTYKGEFSEDGFYSCTMKVKDYAAAGKYKMKVFAVEPDGNRVQLRSVSIMEITANAGGTLIQKSQKPEKGTFVLSMSGFTAPAGVKSIRFGIWTQKNKKDKYFYTATRQTDGSFKATINIKNHTYNDGTFHVRPVIVMGNKVEEVQETVDFNFLAKNIPFVIDKGNGRRIVGIVGPSSTKDIKFAVWGNVNDQNDLKWYPGTASGNKWTAEVVCYDHKETGTYNMHAYAGKNVLGTKTFKVTQEDLRKNGYFYENGLKFYYIDGVLQKNYRSKVPGPYQICVNRTHCTITVYAKDGDNGFIQPISYFPCSVGVDWAPTPTGIFHLSSKLRWKHFYTWDTYVQYAVRYSEGRFFHSVTCTAPSVYALDPGSYNKLGSPASHGCIRLTVVDAKWIYGNIKSIAEVKIYDSADPGPFGKAPHIIIPPNQTWDPTDPAITG